MHEGGKKAVMAALLANGGIAVAKFAGFAVTGAASMLAEAIHSVADTGNQGLLLVGASRAKRAPDAQHPFGYGRERFFWAFVVAMVLFSIGSMFALFEGYEKLRHPHELEYAPVAIGILGVAIVLETFSFRTAFKEAKKVKGDQSWPSFIKRTKSPELAVVLLEDIGALVGLVFALTGVVLAEVTGNPRFDAVGSVAIGLLLGAIAFVLAKENKSLLIGEAAEESKIVAITDAISSTPDVVRLIHIRTLHLGPEELLVAAKIEFDSNLDLGRLSTAINSCEERIRAAVSEARLIFIEPDRYQEPSLSAGSPSGSTED